MRIFNLDIEKLIKLLLPTFLRKERVIAFLDAITAPIQRIYTRFRANREQNLHQLSITPQVFSLEKMLNDRYDSRLRRIYITDGMFRNASYVYLAKEQQPVYVHTNAEATMYIYNAPDVDFLNETFVVHIPATLTAYTEEITQMLNIYKLASRTFNIVTI